MEAEPFDSMKSTLNYRHQVTHQTGHRHWSVRQGLIDHASFIKSDQVFSKHFSIGEQNCFDFCLENAGKFFQKQTIEYVRVF